MQCRPLCTRTAAQSLRDHTLLFLQDPCLLWLPGLMASSKGCKTNGKSLVRLCLIWHQVPAVAPAGQIATGARATEPPEFCQQDGWCAARGRKTRRTWILPSAFWIPPEELSARVEPPSHFPNAIQADPHKSTRRHATQLKDF